MTLPTPRLEIFQDRIRENAISVIRLCHEAGVRVACVSKVTSAHHAVPMAFEFAGADMIADSRVANLRALKEMGFKGPFLLLRLPAPSEAFEVVRHADFSLNSSLVTLRCLSEAAGILRMIHRVIIMVDIGDLREGVWPDKAVDLVKAAKNLDSIEICGLGCNSACFGGVIPTEENMNLLVRTRNECVRETGLELPILSGGNSAVLPLLKSGKLPREINHLRIGEAIVLGRNVIDRTPFPGTRQDTFIAVGEVIECEKKPSVPIGPRGQNAFGDKTDFVDRGIRNRAICNLGRQEITPGGISPVDPRILVLGGSSDHLILDVEDSEERITVGSEIKFYPGYGALLALSASDHTYKIVLKGD